MPQASSSEVADDAGPRAAAPAGNPSVTRPVAPAHGEPLRAGPDALAARAARLLAQPGLVVVSGGPGVGRSTLLRRIAGAFRGPVYAGGGLAMLREVPAFALARAVRARLPTEDVPLLAEAVRSRVRGGLLVLDDLQFADPATLAALPLLAAHCRVVAALRTPHRLGAAAAALRAAATGWLAVAPLDPGAATALARRVAPGLEAAALADIVARAGGVPLAVEALARRAAARGAPAPGAQPDDEVDRVAYAVAGALAELTRPARTAMAALGLLGRPATAALLGAGAGELLAAGLVAQRGTGLAPASPYVAEVAAGMLDEPSRRALHRRLADLVPAREAARHLAAAGEAARAYAVATGAAATAGTAGERAELLLLACDLPGHEASPDVRVSAAAAALDTGRPRAALRAITAAGSGGVAAAVLRGEALLQVGDVAAALAAVAPVPDDADPALVGGRDRIVLLARLAADPGGAAAAAAEVVARHGPQPRHPGLRAALAAVRAAARAPGWEYALASAAAAAGASAASAAAPADGAAGAALAARWSAWLLVETLAADGRLAEAADTADHAARACAADLAYSWQTRFVAAGLWCAALRGTGQDEVARRAGDLTDRSLPAQARGYATAAVSLIEADGGLLAAARARLTAGPGVVRGAAAAVLDWVAREAAWLDGQPDRAVAPGSPSAAPALVAGLGRITARWAAYDGAPAVDADGDAHPPPVRRTLAAWAGAQADPAAFDDAATAWRDVATREEVRCLLAHGLHAPDPARAVPPLLAAERLAERCGLVVLLGRTRRALRRHEVRRDARGPRSGAELTDRERAVLRLVARGEPTRRIAGQLGISAETVETHIRAAMRKLGARTRTEAAVLAERSGPVPEVSR